MSDKKEIKMNNFVFNSEKFDSKLNRDYISLRLVSGEEEIKMKNFVSNFGKFPAVGGPNRGSFSLLRRPLIQMRAG